MKSGFILLLFICMSLMSQDPLVIGGRRAGFFSNFIGVINNLDWCEKNKIEPIVYWGKESYYYMPWVKNVWNYYFEPVSSSIFSSDYKIHNRYFPPTGSPLIRAVSCFSGLSTRMRGKFLIDKYIKVKPNIIKIINNFSHEKMKDHYIIGLHLRGTDKKAEVEPVSPFRIFKAANNKAASLKGKKYKFFVATDEKRLLRLAKKYLKGEVIFYDAFRSENSKPVHKRQNRLLLGQDVFIDASLLSKCDYFIHTTSNVSCAVLLFNPNLPSELLRA